MTLKELKFRWNALARNDAMWAVLTEKGKEHGLWKEEDFYRTGRADVSHVLAWLKSNGIEIDRTKALDFGCGVGRLTSALCEDFKEVDAVDISSEMISRAKKSRDWPSTVRFYENDDPGLSSLSSDRYSFILSLITLQHIPQRTAVRYLASLGRLLRPGGIAYLQMATFLDPSSATCLAKLGRDESLPNRLYRSIAAQLAPKRDLMCTFYCRLSAALAVLERERMQLITVAPEPIESGPFIFHKLVFRKPKPGLPYKLS